MSVFLKMVKDLSFIHICVEDCPVVFASGSSNAYQDGCDHPQLMQTISTLKETVHARTKDKGLWKEM